MKQSKELKIAIVHDFLLYPGGAEMVLSVLAKMYPDAPIYTLLYDKAGMKGMFKQRDVRTSFLQKFPNWLRRRHRWLLPFYATAIETLDLRDFDIVISSSGAWSKGLVTKLKTQHIAYIHSPMRYVWDYNEKYWKNLGKRPSFCVKMYLHYLRVWDRVAADRPDILIANSVYTKERIKKYYRRDAEVVYPPVITREGSQEESSTQNSKEYFLIVSRLTENKRVDVAIEAFNKLGLPLRIIGEGPAKEKLQKQAQDNITFYGWLDDQQVSDQYKQAKAFIHVSEEDFGITIVEAMQYGVPVLAYKNGGAVEIIDEGITGEFFYVQASGMLADVVRRFLEKEGSYDKERIRDRAKHFDQDQFEHAIRSIFDGVIKDV